MAGLWLAKISIKNFLRIHFAEIIPKGRMTIITGKNNAGKSSIIKAIWYAMLGAKYAPEVPTRRGAPGNEVTLTLEGEKTVIVKRDHNELTVKPGKGEKQTWGTEQAMLSSITNKFMLDPQEFVLLRDQGVKGRREQVEQLMQAIKLDVDPKQMDAENAIDFKTRTGVWARRDDLKKQIENIPINPSLPDQRPDIEAIQARLRAAQEHNLGYDRQVEARRQLEETRQAAEVNEKRNLDLIAQIETKIEATIAEIQALEPTITAAAEIRDELAQLVERAGRLGDDVMQRMIATAQLTSKEVVEDKSKRRDLFKESLAAARKTVKAAESQRRHLSEAVAEAMVAVEQAPQPTRQDTDSIYEEIAQARVIHNEMDKRDRANALTKEMNDRDAEANALTRAMEARKERKTQAILNAKMPVPGLTFTYEEGKEEILFNGDPLAQLGQAEQIKISIRIGLATNPLLRLVCIPEGDAFDEDSIAELWDMAEELDVHIIMTKVDTTDELGIVMSEGLVKAVNPAAKPKRKETLA